MRWRLLTWVLLATAVLPACHRPAVETQCPTSSQQGELSVIDSLMWTQPDTALKRLISCYDTVQDRPYTNLLLAELLYKNDYVQTNRTELQTAVLYFDSVSCPFLSARAHYINGVGYYERDSFVSACEEYLKALEIMEEHFDKKELVGKKAKFMAYSYNRLGDLFSNQFMMESAIECYENSLVYCKIEPTSPNGVSSILYRIGVQYDKKGETDKARFYYEQAMEGLKYTDILLYRDIVSSKAIADYQLGTTATQVLDELKQTLAQADNEKEQLHRYLTIGAIFMAERIYDSALFYFVPVFQNETEEVSQIRAAENLRVIYDSLRDKENSDQCVRFLAHHKKPEGECKALVSELDDIFKKYLNKKHERETAKERQIAVRRTGKIGVFGFIMVVVVFIIAMKCKNKEQARAQEMESKVYALEKALNHQRKEAELRREAFLNEAICQKINRSVRSQNITARNSSRKSVTFTDEDAVALRDAVLKHYANFESLLLGKYPKMSHDDLQLCQLYLLGLDERQIAVLQCKTYSAIKKRASLLKGFLGINVSLSAYILKL